jgi:hypothetical protein
MDSPLNRRTFLQLCSACAAFLGQGTRGHAQTKAASIHPVNKSVVKNRKNFVAIQVKPFAWNDEGIDRLLDRTSLAAHSTTTTRNTSKARSSRIFALRTTANSM